MPTGTEEEPLICIVSKTARTIESSSSWVNGYCESFNAKMRDEVFNAELFGNMNEAKALVMG